MPKTTKRDGMERRAERWLNQTSIGQHPDWVIKSLTRLLRKVAREAVRDRDKVLDKWYNEFYFIHKRYPNVDEFIHRKGEVA